MNHPPPPYPAYPQQVLLLAISISCSDWISTRNSQIAVIYAEFRLSTGSESANVWRSSWLRGSIRWPSGWIWAPSAASALLRRSTTATTVLLWPAAPTTECCLCEGAASRPLKHRLLPMGVVGLLLCLLRGRLSRLALPYTIHRHWRHQPPLLLMVSKSAAFIDSSATMCK